MKRKMLLALIVFGMQQANAQCPYTYTTSGNTATFNTLWIIIGTQSVDSVRMNYGDGASILYTAPMPSSVNHTYTSPGTYYVCLTRYISTLGQPGVLVCNYCDSVTVGNSTSNCFVTAGYTSSPGTGNTVNFSNTTSCTSCSSLTTLWDYGDGNTSTVWQGSHTYISPGTYTVCLYETGTNANSVTCIDTFCSTITVGQSTGCIASASFTQNVSGLISSFSNSSTCTGCVTSNYSWDFGDGNTSTMANPTHTYAAAGPYNVCLIMVGVDAQNNTCTDSICQQVSVGNSTAGCSITAAFSEAITGLNVNYSNNSTISNGTITNYGWTFGDGNVSTTASPSHSYTVAGSYNVVLVVNGLDSLQNPCIDSTSKTITVGPSAINNVNSQKLTIYPNPTAKNLTIEVPSSQKVAKLVITDVSGRIINSEYENLGGNKLSVSLKNEASGIYFIKLQTNSNIYTSSIMKQE